MKKYIAVFTWVVFILLLYPVTGQCLQTEVAGRLESNFVLRDTDGFQYGFMDNTEGVQWRSMLKFDLTLKPEYKGAPSCSLEKVFLSYRGAYDAIFELRDKYDVLEDKSPDDFEYGKDDVEWENDLREAFVDLVAQGGMQKVTLRLGRQLVAWGEADGFNLINIVCPNDYSYQMFFSDIDDTITPLWMARLNYSSADLGPFRSVSLELLAIPDIRPTQFAPMHDKNGKFTTIAPYAFSMEAFNAVSDGTIQFTNTDFMGRPEDDNIGNPAMAMTYEEDVAARTLDNMEYGIKLETTFGNFMGALHYFVGFQDDPAVDMTDVNDPAAGFGIRYFNWAMGPMVPGTEPIGPHAIFTHPRQRTYGFSFNYWIDPLGGVFRGEGSLTDKVHLTYMNAPDLTGVGPRKVYQSLLAFDKDNKNLEKWIGTRSNLTTALQVWWRHVNDMSDSERFINYGKDMGRAYPQDANDSYRVTLTAYTDYFNGRIFPQIFAMYDTKGTFMTNAMIKYDPDGKWLFVLTEQSFWGNRDAVSPFAGLIDESELSFKVMYRF